MLAEYSPATAQPWKEHGKMQVSPENPHYLEFRDGTPFFWLGDTGWELIHRLNREEIKFYLDDRRSKGFNVIQTVIISEFIHMDKATNYFNDSIFVNENPENPFLTEGNNPLDPAEYDFWDHVDFVVRTAESKGLFLALLPSWGEWVIPRAGKPLFNTESQAYNYGWFLGDRYKNFQNTIWMLGGDREPDERNEGIAIWRSMAEGITDGTNGIKKQDGYADYSATFMTHHSYNSSSKWFHSDPWIDFHTWGSYHADVNSSRSYELPRHDWNLSDPKPTINSEPCYEDHPVNYAIENNGVFTATDVRVAAYWSIFSGSAGFTYGAHPVWQFTDSIRSKYSDLTFHSWQQALDLPGALQLGFLKNLMESGSMKGLNPDNSLIVSGLGICSDYCAAIRNKSHAYIYIPTGNQITLKMGCISGKNVKTWWFDPRTGNRIFIAEFENNGLRVFDVPGISEKLSWLRSGRGCDWVLIIEDSGL